MKQLLRRSSAALVVVAGAIVLSACASAEPPQGGVAPTLPANASSQEQPGPEPENVSPGEGGESQARPDTSDGAQAGPTVTPSSTRDPQPVPENELQERAASAAKEFTAIVTALTAEARASNVGEELPSATLVFDWEDQITSGGVTLTYFDSAFNEPRLPELVYSYYQLEKRSESACIVLIGDADPSVMPLEPGVYNSNYSTYIALEGACSQYGANPTAFPRS